MKLNGWQRVWVFFSAPWVIGGLIAIVFGLRNSSKDDIWGGFVSAVFVPGFLYAFGWGIAWIRRGFSGG